MSSPQAPQLSVTCMSQFVTTPVAQREQHALFSGLCSPESSVQFPALPLPQHALPGLPSPPVSCSERIASCSMELTCSEQLDSYNSLEPALAQVPADLLAGATLQRAKGGHAGLPSARPLAAVFQFGISMRGPRRAASMRPQELSRTSPSLPGPQGIPHTSVLSKGNAARPLAPVVTLSKCFVHAMRPCTIKLTGSVRLRGDHIIPLPCAWKPPMPSRVQGTASSATTTTPARPKPSPRVPSLTPSKPPRVRRKAACTSPSLEDTATRGSHQPQTAPAMAPARRRELSFADLLAAQHSPGSTDASAPGTPAAPVAVAPPAAVPPPSPLTFVPPVGLAAQMAVTPPRKRARKSPVPNRAPASEEEATLQHQPSGGAAVPKLPCLPGESDGESSWQEGYEEAAPGAPRKAARRK